MTGILVPVPEADIDRLIAEDVGFGDLTTTALGIGDVPAVIRFTARHPLVACATEEASRILTRLGASVRLLVRSGRAVDPGTLLLEAHGSAAVLHAGWKAAQTLVEWASGVASAVHDLRQAATAVAPGIVVACTRKASPLSRGLSIKAVLAGGGTMHRTGLSDTVLVFPEHRVFLPATDPADLVGRLRGAVPERRIVVEVNDAETALRFAAAGADVLQLEKFTPEEVSEVARALARLPHPPVLAAAGGINVGNAAAYAASGAGILVTSWPYTVGPRDVQVRLGPEAAVDS
ncbi:putative pyrophosphorylase ModD [Rhodovastum atsumiense]|uniref:Putative pyrophosphorylase ModD n=1 Tax=Rhodovastum atsumiense TaxID=504468 RepID=A0A5M6IVX5_9PROT|nr:ModD protein [Rhodovastum atsumiense]KAA5611987.1 ModD protein [Rhodovastum atsumiense]CAH2598767.1 putative pyrophosphorylase ModD [Rhodovastum atsumiense]